jgi:hypothetical protein
LQAFCWSRRYRDCRAGIGSLCFAHSIFRMTAGCGARPSVLRNTLSPFVTDSNPNNRYAEHNPSQRWVICEEVIGNVPDSTPPDSPSSSSVCPAANRVAAAAFRAANSTSSSAEPMCSIERDPFAPGPHDLNCHRPPRTSSRCARTPPGRLRPDISVQIPPETGTKTQVNDPQLRQQPET